jgi:hypothetical protein
LEQDIVDTVRALVRGKQTMGERVRAISDFFTQRDDLGNPVFTYDIHPGKSPDPRQCCITF